MSRDKRLKIGIDLDGVCADFVGAFRKLAQATIGKPADAAPSVDWDFSNWGISDAEMDQLWKQIRATPNFWYTLAPEGGTSALLQAYRKHRLFFITTRVPTVGLPVEEQSARWLDANFNIGYPTVLVTKKKGLVAQALELDAFIDDKLSNCDEVFPVVNATYLKDTSYNQEAIPYARVATLDEFLARYL